MMEGGALRIRLPPQPMTVGGALQTRLLRRMMGGGALPTRLPQPMMVDGALPTQQLRRMTVDGALPTQQLQRMTVDGVLPTQHLRHLRHQQRLRVASPTTTLRMSCMPTMRRRTTRSRW